MKAYLEPGDIKKLESAATNTRDRLFIRILSRSGCRVSEAIQLTIDDIDLVNSRIIVHYLKKRVTANCPHCRSQLAKVHSYCPHCGKEIGMAVKIGVVGRIMRTLPVDGETLEMLERFIQKGGPVSKNGKQTLFGFNRHRGWQIMRDCAKRAGLGNLVNTDTGKTRGVSPHRLRDAFAVNAIQKDNSGNGLIILQKHLGHASFNTTARYRKIADEEHRQWYDKVWDKGEEELGG